MLRACKREDEATPGVRRRRSPAGHWVPLWLRQAALAAPTFPIVRQRDTAVTLLFNMSSAFRAAEGWGGKIPPESLIPAGPADAGRPWALGASAVRAAAAHQPPCAGRPGAEPQRASPPALA